MFDFIKRNAAWVASALAGAAFMSAKTLSEDSSYAQMFVYPVVSLAVSTGLVTAAKAASDRGYLTPAKDALVSGLEKGKAILTSFRAQQQAVPAAPAVIPADDSIAARNRSNPRVRKPRVFNDYQ